MRKIKIRTANVLVWVAVLLAAAGFGSTAAFAQSFDFTYSGNGGSLVKGVFNVTGSPGNYLISGISGAASGFSVPADNGPITGLAIFGGNDNSLFFPNTPFLDGNGVSYQVSGGENENLFSFTDGNTVDYAVANNLGSSSGSLSITGATPAPVPGPASCPISFSSSRARCSRFDAGEARCDSSSSPIVWVVL
jgi:hypothetical protein